MIVVWMLKKFMFCSRKEVEFLVCSDVMMLLGVLVIMVLDRIRDFKF